MGCAFEVKSKFPRRCNLKNVQITLPLNQTVSAIDTLIFIKYSSIDTERHKNPPERYTKLCFSYSRIFSEICWHVGSITVVSMATAADK